MRTSPAPVRPSTAMKGPRRDVAVITKMLHLKRPSLVPVLGSLVIEQLGGGRSKTRRR